MNERGRREELRALARELVGTEADAPSWRVLLAAIAASEAVARRRLDGEEAGRAFFRALQANSGPSADTFMARPRDAAIGEDLAALGGGDAAGARVAAAIAQAVAHARAGCGALLELNAAATDQPLLVALRRDTGWLRVEPLRRAARDGVDVVFLLPNGAWIATLHVHAGEAAEDAEDARLARALGAAAARAGAGTADLRRLDPDAGDVVQAAFAVSVPAVALADGRSFHRRAWSRAGGPWLGLADAGRWSLLSTCHVAVDGYAHGRVADAIAGRLARRAASLHEALVAAAMAGGAARARAWPAEPAPATLANGTPGVGFAATELPPDTHFSDAAHAFARVLDARVRRGTASDTAPAFGDVRPVGANGVGHARSAPFQIALSPGAPGEEARWRRRAIYGLWSLHRDEDGAWEDRRAFAARMRAHLEREAAGNGLLTRVLRMIAEAPLPAPLLRGILGRAGTLDLHLAATRAVVGNGYVSWMRFPRGEEPLRALYPSAVPGFSAAQPSAAGLSIVRHRDGLAAGLTTTGALGTDGAAASFLAELRAALEDDRD